MENIDRQIAEKIKNWAVLHTDEMVEDIKKLVSIKSVCTFDKDVPPYGQGCRDVLDTASAMCAHYGLTVSNLDYHCCIAKMKGTLNEEIGLFAHLDVVPEGNDWLRPPYEPYVENGHIIGRGTSDNKGPLVAALYAIRCLKDVGVNLKHALMLFMGCAEEAGMSDIQYYLAHQKAPVFSFTPDAMYSVCHGEKGILNIQFSRDISDGNIVDFHGGQANNSVADSAEAFLSGVCFEHAVSILSSYEHIHVTQKGDFVCVKAKGIAAHAAFPENSLNAIWLLAKVLSEQKLAHGSALEAMRFLAQALAGHDGTNLGLASADEVSGKTTCIGGLAFMKEGILTQDVNVRYAISASADDMKKKMEDILKPNGFVLNQFNDSKPTYFPKDAPETQLLDGIVAEFYPNQYTPYVMGGGTYARKLPHAVGFGPGTKNQSPYGGGHQPNEGVSIDTLLTAVQIYALSLYYLDSIV